MSSRASPCQLVVFCGLPGVGKTAISRRVADQLGATFLRIDTIEAAIVSTLAPFENNPVGYVIAGWVAADQLRSGRPVVAEFTVARDCAVPVRFIEVICSDVAEHRRRVENRTREMPGHGIPTWDQVQRRPWEPLIEPHLTIGNIADPNEHVTAVLDWLARPDSHAEPGRRLSL